MQLRKHEIYDQKKKIKRKSIKSYGEKGKLPDLSESWDWEHEKVVEERRGLKNEKWQTHE